MCGGQGGHTGARCHGRDEEGQHEGEMGAEPPLQDQ